MLLLLEEVMELLMIDEIDDKDDFNVFLVNFVVLLRSWKYNDII